MSKHDYVLCYGGVPDQWRVKPEDLERVEERSGARFREETITVKTTWNFTGQIEQLVLAPTGVMQRRVLDTMERQARDALTSLGWVPPAKKS